MRGSRPSASVSAAGAEQDAGEDDQPDPVVIKKLTNAVAVHMITLPFEIGKVQAAALQPPACSVPAGVARNAPSAIILCRFRRDVRGCCRIF